MITAAMLPLLSIGSTTAPATYFFPSSKDYDRSSGHDDPEWPSVIASHGRMSRRVHMRYNEP